MIFDTDVFILIQRGSKRAAAQPLCTSNVKHFRSIPLFEIERFVP